MNLFSYSAYLSPSLCSGSFFWVQFHALRFLTRHSQRGDGDLLKTGLQAERAVVEEQRNHLTKEQASLRLAVEQMEKDILQIRGNISQLGGSEVGFI